MLAAFSRFGRQLFDPPKDTIRGLDTDTWYSPLQPVQPFAPEGTEPRGMQYWAGQNMLWTPRADSEYTAADLKELARYPLARICIENVKDAVCRIPWEIQLRAKPNQTKKQQAAAAKGDANLIKLSKFFEYPDREHNWQEWLRPLLEDMLVIDAAAILVRKTFKGEIVELPVIRGESIVRYIDVNGFTPVAPDPAYAQNWWGLPLVNLSTDQLIYKPRNIVPRNTISSQLYGMSQTEQLADEIKVGIQRLAFTLAYYTEGSIPGVVQVVPRGTTPDQISAAMQWMNSELAGNLSARRQWRMVQGFNEPGKPDQIEFTKEPLLADQFDDLHIRKIAFGYGTSAQRLLRLMNRASSQSNQDAAEEEGTLVYLSWLKGVMDYIIRRTWGMPDYEMVFDPSSEPDPQKEADTVTGLSSKGVITLNEARTRVGEEPRPEPEADQLGVVTATGFVPLSFMVDQAAQQAAADKAAAAAKPGGKPSGATTTPEAAGPSSGKKPGGIPPPKFPKAANGNGNGAGTDWAHCDSHGQYVSTCGECGDALNKSLQAENEALAKTAKQVIQPGRSHPTAILARHSLEKIMANSLKRMRKKTMRELRKTLNKIIEGTLLKAKGEEETLSAILKSLAGEWSDLGDAAEKPLIDGTLAGSTMGSLQLEITDEGLLGKINTLATEWASDRAAEMVGMRRGKNGKLTGNPDAKWAISDTTRDKLRTTITKIFAEDEPTMDSIETAIEEAGIFTDARAAMIANTEIARAQSQGNLTSWKQSGLVKTVEWQLSADHDMDDQCNDLANGGPYSIDAVPEHPSHPNCACVLVLGELREE